MNVEAISALVLDDTGIVSMTELCEQSGLSESELAMLVDSGALAPRDVQAGLPTFSASCVVVARTARRLRDDFALEDAHAVAIMMRLRERIDALEQELRQLRAML